MRGATSQRSPVVLACLSLAVAAAKGLAPVLTNPVKRDPVGSARPIQVPPSPSRSHRDHPAPSCSCRPLLAPPPASTRGRSANAQGGPPDISPTPPLLAPYTAGSLSPPAAAKAKPGALSNRTGCTVVCLGPKAVTNQFHSRPLRLLRSRSNRQQFDHSRLSLLAKLALVRPLKYPQEAPVALGPSPRTHAHPARVSRLPARPRPSARRSRGGPPARPSPPMPSRRHRLLWRRVSPTHAVRHPRLSVLSAGSPGEVLPRPHPCESGGSATSA